MPSDNPSTQSIQQLTSFRCYDTHLENDRLRWTADLHVFVHKQEYLESRWNVGQQVWQFPVTRIIFFHAYGDKTTTKHLWKLHSLYTPCPYVTAEACATRMKGYSFCQKFMSQGYQAADGTDKHTKGSLAIFLDRRYNAASLITQPWHANRHVFCTKEKNKGTHTLLPLQTTFCPPTTYTTLPTKSDSLNRHTSY